MHLEVFAHAQDSFVAHMWRKPDDPRTRAKYTLKAGRGRGNFSSPLQYFQYLSICLMVLKFVFELQHSTHFAHFPVHKKAHCRIAACILDHLGSSQVRPIGTACVQPWLGRCLNLGVRRAGCTQLHHGASVCSQQPTMLNIVKS